MSLVRLFLQRNTRRTLFVFMRPTALINQLQIDQAAERHSNRLEQGENTPVPLGPLKRETGPIKTLPLESNGLY